MANSDLTHLYTAHQDGPWAAVAAWMEALAIPFAQISRGAQVAYTRLYMGKPTAAEINRVADYIERRYPDRLAQVCRANHEELLDAISYKQQRIGAALLEWSTAELDQRWTMQQALAEPLPRASLIEPGKPAEPAYSAQPRFTRHQRQVTCRWCGYSWTLRDAAHAPARCGACQQRDYIAAGT